MRHADAVKFLVNKVEVAVWYKHGTVIVKVS
jgi:hypothetical protein